MVIRQRYIQVLLFSSVLLCASVRADAAIVTRYFSTTGAGAADGTTWADRAELDPAGTWASVILLFAFNGADAMVACIGPGTYTFTTGLASGLFVNPPSAVNPLFLVGCDGSGNRLSIPDPNWQSNEAAFDDSTLPVLATTTNIATVALSNTFMLLLKLTASGRNGAVASPTHFDWSVVVNSTANTAAVAVGTSSVSNSVLSCTGSSYSAVATPSNGNNMDNVRVVGVTGSSGNRDGVAYAGTTARTAFTRLTILSNGGRGWVYTGTNVGVTVQISSSTIANNSGDGITFPNTAAQTAVNVLDRLQVTGNGAIGINPGGANTNLLITQSRLRDNTTSNFGTTGNFPIDFNIYTTDSDDATEYVNTGGGNFQIKNTAATWGLGFGVSDEVPASSGFKNFLGGQH